jgi:hypothetical protein
MSTPAPTPSNDSNPTAPDAWERALLDRQLESLSRLADMGMAIAGAIERRVTAEAPADEPANVLHQAAMDFARVSRAVRLTFALQSRLIADFKAPRRAKPAEAGADDDDDWDGTYEVEWLPSQEDPRDVRKQEVKDAVRARAESEALDREDVERLVLRAAERLETEEFRGLFAWSVDELVEMICKDLGLAPPPQAAGATEGWAARAPPLDAGVRAIAESD